MRDSGRPFGFWMATALVIGGMIGSGIFVMPGQLAPFGWTGLVAWIVAIGGAAVIALILVRLAAAVPEAPGAVAICAAALGPLAGVLVGWAYWVSVWSANAIIAVTAVRYLAAFWPPLAATPVAQAGSAVALIWLITILNLQGARAAGWFQLLTTILKLLPLVAVTLLLAWFAVTGGGAFANHSQASFAPGQLTPALTLAFFAMVGFESASVAAERIRDPARNVARATLGGVVLTGLLYLFVSTGIVLAMPGDALAASTAPVALFVQTYLGEGAGLAVAAFAAIATIGCLNGWVLVQGEVPLGMARAGLLPRWIARTSRRDVPVGVLLVSSSLASLLVLSNTARSTAGLVDFMLRLTAASCLWLYLGACAAALAMGLSRALALVGIGFGLWALWGAGAEAGGLSLVLMLTALPLYWLRGKAMVAAPG